ncbi:MAG: hypothetical protein ACSHYF_02520 [Verrucomicrobiaceae bacterium]
MNSESEHLLIHKFFDQSLQAGEKDELEGLLLSSPEAREEFRRIGQIHGLLRLSSEMTRGRNAAATDIATPFLPKNASSRPTSPARRNLLLVAVSVAACIGIYLSLDYSARSKNTSPPVISTLPGLASITSNTRIEWGEISQKPRDNQLDAGIYHLGFGNLRFEMGAGAAVCVSAPCQFEILSPKAIRVAHGKLTARLPDKEDELIITMPGLKLTDLGTGFGVDVSKEGESLVSVFEGKVELQGQLNESSTILQAGRSIKHSNTKGHSLQPLKFDPTPFRDLWPLTLGIDDASDLVNFAPPGPPDSTLFSLQDPDHVYLFPEQQSITLEAPLLVDLSSADSTWPNSGKLSYLSKGRSISSYLIFYNPPKGKKVPVRKLYGSITFNREILGVICTAKPLALSDNILGIVMRKHALSANRQLESNDSLEGKVPHDTVTLSSDRRSIHFNFNAREGIDNMRILLSDD